ncbi:uncharacterized protein LOC106179938 [Lingula anatina]|uniref:U8 snoRNA-decapping enzyme n=1 Tax=Lingula anatina TaxID=7574 RepID=A0A1S3K9A2_LINAN|nr:uncharacterized protein LOC106179938 [Lingula anatina]|eukprot:XP_013419203.1 uncharacterized protein LOC106179938 [Lingula anatina]
MAQSDPHDAEWGVLAANEGYGRPDSEEDYEQISYEDAMGKTWGKNEKKPYRHAAHAMIYAPDGKILWDMYENKAVILMTMRFDGYIGFPGGIMDDGETLEFWLNRELEEEIGLDLTRHSFTKEDHVLSHVIHKKKLLLHFYCKRVTLEECLEIEKRTIDADEYGFEVLGPIRVPMFTFKDNERGLPIFLSNKFIGNAKEDLLYCIERENIMTKEEIQLALENCEKFKARYVR